ncbi:NRAMP family divalent metal transporter [Pirellulaceae bacterium SH449]
MSSPQHEIAISDPPRTFWGIVSHLGPGLIIAASIVGSGELIATTMTGANSGLSLLWLIIVGCVIKVFAQIEIGRFTIAHGMPTLTALNTVPGPRVEGKGNWIVWYWFVMWFLSIGQLGGIAGGVGQALALVAPITAQGKESQAIIALETKLQIEEVARKTEREASMLPIAWDTERESTQAEILERRRNFLRDYLAIPEPTDKEALEAKLVYRDDLIWAAPIAFGTSLMLVWGGYRFIQGFATVMVAVFTLVTLGNAIGLQFIPAWSFSTQDWIDGLSFGLPEGDRKNALMIAFATIGIIGVGAAELIQYPYWCLEKGYAKKTGTYDGSEAWTNRARGWLRVMKADIWFSMVIYTVATIAFFVLGAGILHRAGIVPEGSKLLITLSMMYEPVLGGMAKSIFLVGALFVLYSTFYVANASHARTFADAMGIIGLAKTDEAAQRRMVKILSFVFPLLCLLMYWIVQSATKLVLLSGAAQAIMLPMLGYAALHFRWTGCRPGLTPSKIFDLFLVLSVLILFGIGIGSLVLEIRQIAGR